MAEPVPYAPALPGGAKPFQPQQPVLPAPPPAGYGWGAPAPSAHQPTIDWSDPSSIVKATPSAPRPTGSVVTPPAPAAAPHQAWSEAMFSSPPAAPPAAHVSGNGWGAPATPPVTPPHFLAPPPNALGSGTIPANLPADPEDLSGSKTLGDWFRGGREELSGFVDSAHRLGGAVSPANLQSGGALYGTPGSALADVAGRAYQALPGNPFPRSWTLGNLERNIRTGTSAAFLPTGGLLPNSGGVRAEGPEMSEPVLTKSLGIDDHRISPYDLAATRLLASGTGRSLANTFTKYDPVTGAGAVRNFGEGAANIAGGLRNVGRGEFIVGSKQIGKGGLQAGLMAPAQMAGPTALAAVHSATTPGSDQNTTNKFLAGAPETMTTPARTGAGQSFAGRAAAIPHMLGKSLGFISDPSVPSLTEFGAQHLNNIGNAWNLARNNAPAFVRETGNAFSDLYHGLDQTSTSPQNRFNSLANDYRQRQTFADRSGIGLGASFARGVLSASLPQIQSEASKLDYQSPYGPEFARDKLIHDEVTNRLLQQNPGLTAEQIRPVVQSAKLTSQSVPAGTPPLITARDMERAKVLSGQLPGPMDQQLRDKFTKDVDRLYSVFAPQGASQSAPQAQSTPAPFDPALDAQVKKIVGGAMGVGDKAVSVIGDVGSNLKGYLTAAGGIPAALAAASKAPPPPAGLDAGVAKPMSGDVVPGQTGGPAPDERSSLGKYWNELPPASRILAVAGLSLTAISALRSLFGSKGDGDDEESFLMKVLPYLGIGAAAWGLGGGTIGLTREALPSLDKYKQLGNSLGDSVGLGKMFGQ